MSAEVQNGRVSQEPELIDRIANALPEELRADYYREMAHCRTLPESDEMLRILRAMQFLTILIEQTPARLAAEREQLAGALSGSIASLQAAHQTGVAYQKQLEARLSKLPEEIARGVSADAIAAKLNEHLRQQMQEIGLSGLVDAIEVQAAEVRKASKELSVALDNFSHPRHGAVPVVNDALASMKTNIANAADHIRVQMNGLGKELWRTIGVIFASGVTLGLVLGVLYYRWLISPYDNGRPVHEQVGSAEQNPKQLPNISPHRNQPGRVRQQ